jgi:hypothetical protein
MEILLAGRMQDWMSGGIAKRGFMIFGVRNWSGLKLQTEMYYPNAPKKKKFGKLLVHMCKLGE